jgi:hypothetical protein
MALRRASPARRCHACGMTYDAGRSRARFVGDVARLTDGDWPAVEGCLLASLAHLPGRVSSRANCCMQYLGHTAQRHALLPAADVFTDIGTPQSVLASACVVQQPQSIPDLHLDLSAARACLVRPRS